MNGCAMQWSLRPEKRERRCHWYVYARFFHDWLGGPCASIFKGEEKLKIAQLLLKCHGLAGYCCCHRQREKSAHSQLIEKDDTRDAVSKVTCFLTINSHHQAAAPLPSECCLSSSTGFIWDSYQHRAQPLGKSLPSYGNVYFLTTATLPKKTHFPSMIQ